MPHTSDDTLLTAGLSSFRLDLVDHIAHLVLNRPDAFNTLNPRFWQELDLVLDTLQRSGQSRAGHQQHGQAFLRRHGTRDLCRPRLCAQ
jgi:enoyl-CoA hydratase